VLWVPSTPIVFPRRSAGAWMPLEPEAMIDAILGFLVYR